MMKVLIGMVILSLAATFAGGCAAPAPSDAPAAGAEPIAGAPLAAPQRRVPAADRLTEQVLCEILTAEFAGQRGLYDFATDKYLELVRQLRDKDVAQRATHIAVFSKRYEAAREAADIWVEVDPENLEARQALASLQIRSGEIDAAVENLEWVLRSDEGDSAQKFRAIASFLGREAEVGVGMAVMERLIENRQDDADALFAYALLALRDDQTDKAREAMERVLEIEPPSATVAMAYLSILQKQGDKETAIAWLEKALSDNPEQAELRMLYARMLADAGEFEQARRQFELLAEIAPDNADVHYALGLLYLQESRLDEAKASFTTLIEQGNRVNEASYYLGQIANIENKFEEALRWFQAVDSGENRFNAQLNAALILAKLGRADEAQQQLDGIEPRGPEQRLRLVRVRGEILTDLGELQAAMDVYDQALEGGYNSELLYSRAMLAEKMGRLELLENDLRAILAQEPDNAQALNALGYTLADRTDRYNEAYQLIERALELSPKDFYILDSMGWVLYRLGRLDEAVTFLRRARAIRDDAEVAAHLAEVLWAKGDKDGARHVWESALQTTPNHPMLLDVIERFSP
jgi:tetratricopeptide (TPR) repeat protein